MLARQCGNLRVERGDLDRDHFRLWPLQPLQILLQTLLRLRLAQNGFTEKIHIHAHAFLRAIGKMPDEQFLFTGQNDVGRLLLHVLLDERQRDAGQIAAKRLKTLHQGPIHRPKKARHTLHVEDVGEVLDGARRIVRAERLVGHLRERGLVRRRLEHPIQLGLLAFFRRGLQLGGALLQAAREEQRLLHGWRGF